MTTRIYYGDSRTIEFDATVLACVPVEGRFEVQLDRTAFYPTSGGQPFDTGTIGGVPVIDVIDHDDHIGHVVERPVAVGSLVRGEIDWTRRRDHREQHTGQHVLSAAFDAVCGVATVGFHMGAEVSTVDLNREVTAAEIVAAEERANEIVRENREVSVRMVSADEAATLPLRKASARQGPLRIVEVRDFDVSACGGTHVEHTGEIGSIASLAAERVRGGTRLSFVCGARAVHALQRLRATTADVARHLGVGTADVVQHVERLQQAARDTERTVRALREELVVLRAREWRTAVETIGTYRVVLRMVEGEEAPALKACAQAIVADPGLVVVLVGSGQQIPIVVGRSSDVEFDAGQLIKLTTAALGGRGGGRAELAQGGIPAPADAIVAFVRRALREY